MPTPVLSICIPTYNRARYLQTCLTMLVGQLAKFPHSFELVISDNASTDDTQAIIAAFESKLPIRKFLQTKNLGAYPNWMFVIGEARGELVMYLADDDTLVGESLADAVGQLLAAPEIGVAYAPWAMIDVPAGKSQGQFYTVPETFRVAKGDFKRLLDVILRHGIWPELPIMRRSVLRAAMGHLPDTTFSAFMHAGEFLARAAVLFLKTPYYVFVSRHFEGDQRTQVGNVEAQDAWDRYRGGLEYLLARALPSGMSTDEHRDYTLRISDFVAGRICVAIRLRRHTGQSPTEIFSLALRAVAMGAEAGLPEPLNVIRSRAAFHFLATDAQLNLFKKRLVVLGGGPSASTRALLAEFHPDGLEFMETVPPLEALRDALVLVGTDRRAAVSFTEAELAGSNARLVHEADLMAKFFW